jgi:hypothetical protein
MANLLRLSRVDETPGFPLKKSTLYKWVHTRKHPEVFVRIGGAVFVDLDAFGRLVEKGRCVA